MAAPASRGAGEQVVDQAEQRDAERVREADRTLRARTGRAWRSLRAAVHSADRQHPRRHDRDPAGERERHAAVVLAREALRLQVPQDRRRQQERRGERDERREGVHSGTVAAERGRGALSAARARTSAHTSTTRPRTGFSTCRSTSMPSLRATRCERRVVRMDDRDQLREAERLEGVDRGPRALPRSRARAPKRCARGASRSPAARRAPAGRSGRRRRRSRAASPRSSALARLQRERAEAVPLPVLDEHREEGGERDLRHRAVEVARDLRVAVDRRHRRLVLVAPAAQQQPLGAQLARALTAAAAGAGRRRRSP